MSRNVNFTVVTTTHRFAVAARKPSGPGALAGWESRCTCGDVQSTSLSRHAAWQLGQAHVAWHARTGR